VRVSKSSIDRWIDEVAERLPSAAALVEELNRRQPITAGHFDGFFPRGAKGKCVLVLQDEHGRIIATDEIDAEKEEQVKPLLLRLKRLGLPLKTFYIDHRQALRKAIHAVYPQARIQYDYFHILQNIWKKLWSYMRAHRKAVEARSKAVRTAWYRDKLEALAKTLWKKRYLLFKSDEHMSPEEQQQLVEIMEADPKVGKLRAFLQGVWHIFRDSRDEQEARAALEALKQVKLEPKAREHTEKVFSFLEDHFELMITSLKHRDVQRNSLAESGMRVLRRLEVEHDGFRTPKGRENCLKIYQAVKYLGWSVHNPNFTPVG
jgi:transposase-like protein